MEKFDTFLLAIKSVISEIDDKETAELKKMKIGTNTVIFNKLPEMMLDIVLVVDKGDVKTIKKMMPQLVSIIQYHENLFIEGEIQSEQLQSFDQDITHIFLTNKKILDKSFIESREKSIWVKKGELSDQITKKIIEEEEGLITKLNSTKNNIEKLAILENLLKISDKLEDGDKLIEYQKQAQLIKNELKDRKIRLKYYLKKTKESLRGTPIRDEKRLEAYSNFLSFCSKLKNFTSSQVHEKYQKLAQNLGNAIEITSTVKEILSMGEDIDAYLQ